MKENKDMLLISIFTFTTMMAWIVFDVYHAAVTSTLTEVQQKLVSPLSPKINPETLKSLKLRQLK